VGRPQSPGRALGAVRRRIHANQQLAAIRGSPAKRDWARQVPRPIVPGLIPAACSSPEIFGEARHARWCPLTEAAETAAVVGLRVLAGGRNDLPAEVAGICEGMSEGELGEPLARGRRAAMPHGTSRRVADTPVGEGGAAQGRGRPDAAAWRRTPLTALRQARK